MSTSRFLGNPSDVFAGTITDRFAVRAAVRGGIDALFSLCVSKASLSMADIRRLHASRFELINPVSDMIDRRAGPQWNATPRFGNGGASEAYTVDCEPLRTMFQFVIYGELFSSTLQSFLDPTAQLPRYDLKTRLEFVRYCIPF